MERKGVAADLRIFWSPLVPATMCLCILAGIMGVPGIWMLFDGAYRAYLVQDLITGGITAGSAVKTYAAIGGALTVIGPVCAAAMAGCLAAVVLGKPVEGLGSLSTLAEWLVRGINLAGIGLAGLFAFRFIAYTVSCLRTNGGVYYLYAMVISEGLMGALAGFLFVNLRKFVNCLCDSGASMAYTFASGKIKSHTIPGFTSTGFFLLALVCLLVAVDQLLTVTIVYDPVTPYYKLLVSQHPVQWATAASFLCGGVADILMGSYLRRYKRICERVLYREHRREMGLY